VIAVFVGLDVVKEPVVHDGAVERRDGPQQGRRTVGVATGDDLLPFRDPQPFRGRAVGGIDAPSEGELIEHRMSDAAVTPIQDGEGARQATDVPGMEVAVHQGVRETAGRQVGEPCGQPVDEGVDPLAFGRVEFVAMTVDGRADARHQGGGAKVGEVQRE
jgi:hypothetical protein